MQLNEESAVGSESENMNAHKHFIGKCIFAELFAYNSVVNYYRVGQ